VSTVALATGAPQAAERILEELDHTRAVRLVGPPMAGKSAALGAVASALPAKNLHPVHVEPPLGDADEAMVMLASVAAGLAPFDGELLDYVRRPSTTWDGKVDRVCGAVDRHHDRVVLLFDEFSASTRRDADLVTRSSAELFARLTSARARTVVAGTRPLFWAGARDVRIEPESRPQDVLLGNSWNGLGQHARRMHEAGGDRLARRSSLELRLGVALVASGVDIAEIIDTPSSPATLVRRLFETLRDAAELRELVGKLAVLRTPFDESWPIELGRDQLDDPARELLVHAMLSGRPGALRLHEVIQREARLFEWSRGDALVQAHRLAAAFHRRRYDDAMGRADLVAATRHEMENVHHLTQAGDFVAVMKAQVYFGAQYDLLGKALSIADRRADAVACYERAIDCDPDDDYAHHYLAYNLDVLAQEPPRVEAEYRAALELRPDHPWYHGRLICFLITRGRITDAKHQWELALSHLLPGGAEEEPYVYRELHRPVARLLLHRGELAWARRTLEEIPTFHRREPWFGALLRLHIILAEAEREETVFPPYIPLAERWNGPHLVSSEEGVRSWRPGYVASFGDIVNIRTARRDRKTGREVFEWREYPQREFVKIVGRRLSHAIRAGAFIEIIELDSGETLILPHSREYADENLPGVFPRSDRYLRGSA
jgi:tetratricopeptide (TPR) repeat protein